MAQQTQRLGGLVGLNTGRIEDCHCRTRLRGGAGDVMGGLCGENRGELLRSFAQSQVPARGRHGGLTGRQDGAVTHCFWVREKGMEQDDWPDWSLSMTEDEVSRERLNTYDFEGVWWDDGRGAGGVGLYRVNPPEGPHDRVVDIGDREALLEFARQVNSGETAPGTLYRLTADIDLKGKSWTPVGLDPNAAFHGCFDGCGHKIHNFVVHAKKYPYAGLFGCVGAEGAVRDLCVDCVIEGHGSCAGPVCGMNGGEIANCVAVAHTDGSRYAGGLVGQNAGAVLRCYAGGRVGGGALIPWWVSALLLLLLCFPMPVYFAVTAQAEAEEVFAPVILDPNAVPIEPDDEGVTTPPPEEVTDTSASFIMNAEMWVSTENYAGSAGLRCPTWSTRGFVATVRVTADDLARVGIASDQEYQTLYQSGLIVPGYGVDVIALGPLADGSRLPPGEYELSVLLEFYDVETNEKSAVNTVIPLETTVS